MRNYYFTILYFTARAIPEKINKEYGYVSERVRVDQGPKGRSVFAHFDIEKDDIITISRNDMILTPDAAFKTAN